jgi:hypothetical protein
MSPYLQRRKPKGHTHKYFVDSFTSDAVCLCGKVRGSKKAEPGKYKAIRCSYNGYIYDSKFEAQTAMELDWRLKAGEITKWEKQFPIEIRSPSGELIVRHRVDFRATLKDGSYELIESKGFETRDYRLLRKLIEMIWLPQHLDHVYTVYK